MIIPVEDVRLVAQPARLLDIAGEVIRGRQVPGVVLETPVFAQIDRRQSCGRAHQAPVGRVGSREALKASVVVSDHPRATRTTRGESALEI